MAKILQLPVPSMKSSLTSSQGGFLPPQKTFVAFLPALFVLLQALSEADSRAAVLFLE